MTAINKCCFAPFLLQIGSKPGMYTIRDRNDSVSHSVAVYAVSSSELGNKICSFLQV